MSVRFLRGRVVKAAWESYVNLEARSRKLWPVFRNQRLSHQQHQRPHHARLVRLRASPRYRQHRLTRQKSARTSRSTRLPPGSKRINFASNSVTSAVANNSAIQSLASIGCSPLIAKTSHAFFKSMTMPAVGARTATKRPVALMPPDQRLFRPMKPTRWWYPASSRCVARR